MISTAERRMFAKTIIDSDAFLEMSQSAQLLYFHLAMRADDDGFVNKPNAVMRTVGCHSADAQMLVDRKFIIPFESGIVVIKHWKIHNYIQKDRYHETKYTGEKSSLQVEESGEYSLPVYSMDTECIQHVSKMDTQVRLGKVRLELGKGSTGEDRGVGETTADKPPEAEPTPYSEIQSLYLSLCPSFPRIKTLSANRKKAIHARWMQYGKSLDAFRQLFEKAESSDFLKGKNTRNWSADFDWMLKDNNMAKILEGKYDNEGANRDEYTTGDDGVKRDSAGFAVL